MGYFDKKRSPAGRIFNGGCSNIFWGDEGRRFPFFFHLLLLPPNLRPRLRPEKGTYRRKLGPRERRSTGQKMWFIKSSFRRIRFDDRILSGPVAYFRFFVKGRRDEIIIKIADMPIEKGRREGTARMVVSHAVGVSDTRPWNVSI